MNTFIIKSKEFLIQNTFYSVDEFMDQKNVK